MMYLSFIITEEKGDVHETALVLRRLQHVGAHSEIEQPLLPKREVDGSSSAKKAGEAAYMSGKKGCAGARPFLTTWIGKISTPAGAYRIAGISRSARRGRSDARHQRLQADLSRRRENDRRRRRALHG